jgi:hypothetical protein
MGPEHRVAAAAGTVPVAAALRLAAATVTAGVIRLPGQLLHTTG